MRRLAPGRIWADEEDKSLRSPVMTGDLRLLLQIQSIKRRVPALHVTKLVGNDHFPGNASNNSSAFKTWASSLSRSSCTVISCIRDG